jgi:hypothetical protein
MEHHKAKKPAEAEAPAAAAEQATAGTPKVEEAVPQSKASQVSPEDAELISRLSPALRRKLGY